MPSKPIYIIPESFHLGSFAIRILCAVTISRFDAAYARRGNVLKADTDGPRGQLWTHCRQNALCKKTFDDPSPIVFAIATLLFTLLSFHHFRIRRQEYKHEGRDTLIGLGLGLGVAIKRAMFDESHSFEAALRAYVPGCMIWASVVTIIDHWMSPEWMIVTEADFGQWESENEVKKGVAAAPDVDKRDASIEP